MHFIKCLFDFFSQVSLRLYAIEMIFLMSNS